MIIASFWDKFFTLKFPKTGETIFILQAFYTPHSLYVGGGLGRRGGREGAGGRRRSEVGGDDILFSH